MRKRDVDSIIKKEAILYAKENDCQDDSLDYQIETYIDDKMYEYFTEADTIHHTCSLTELGNIKYSNLLSNPKLFTAIAISAVGKNAMFFNINTNSKYLIESLVKLGWKHVWSYKGFHQTLPVHGFFMAKK